jgi:cysteine desulfurase
MAEIGRICKKKGVLFHCDATQACGRIRSTVEALGIDLLSMSATSSTGRRASARCTCAARRRASD